MMHMHGDMPALAWVGGAVVLAGLLGPAGLDHQVAAVVVLPLLLAPPRPVARKYFNSQLSQPPPLLQDRN